MRAVALELMSILARDAKTDDEFADQLAAIAADAVIDGDPVVANGMTQLARQHRIRALKARGMLAAISEEYGGIYHQHLTDG